MVGEYIRSTDNTITIKAKPVVINISRSTHIIVDEVQDLSVAYYDEIVALSDRFCDVTIVGDLL